MRRREYVTSPLLSMRRYFGSNSSSFSSTTVTGPKPELKSWESGARLVKNTTVENRYLDHIRDIHDPSLHVKTIEDELKGTIGKALGKQGEKILVALRCMAAERSKYDDLLRDGYTPRCRQVVQVAQQYNEYRKEAHEKRWELIVHRQAAGFIVGNHKYVTEKFPIDKALPDYKEEGEDDGEENPNHDVVEETVDSAKPKVFGDQLDWWQRIGRWR